MIDEECSRCLREAQAPVKVDFEEEYVPMLMRTPGSRLDRLAGEERMYFRIDSGSIWICGRGCGSIS